MAEPSRLVELRERIDAETVKALIAVNGGGAVALLAFLPNILGKPGYADLAHGMLVALMIFPLGVAAAIVHNILRRECSRIYEQAWRKGGQPQPCRIFGH